MVRGYDRRMKRGWLSGRSSEREVREE